MRIFGPLTSVTGAPRPGSLAYRTFVQLTRVNVVLYRLSGGRVGGSFDGAPVLLLHHVGRRSGRPRVTPLLYLPREDPVVVASMGGSPRHPAWLHNLRARPDTDIELGRERRRVRAEEVGPQERARLWPAVVALYPGYQTYQDRARGREIPLVVLRRA